MAKQLQFEEALAKSAALCSLSEKCVSDIQKKLLSWEINKEDCEKIISRLIQEKYIDENRFARFFVKDKYRFAKWGKTKIAFALKEKGISRENINEALLQIEEEDYSEQLEALLKAKFKSIKYTNDYDAKSKLIRFALGRGFEYEQSLKIAERVIKQNAE